MNRMSKLHRFELAFEGEPQGSGLFQCLRDAGISPIREDELCALFKNFSEVDLSKFSPLEFPIDNIYDFLLNYKSQ